MGLIVEKVIFKKHNDSFHIKYKKYINDTQLKIIKNVQYISTIKSLTLNTVGVSKDTYNELKKKRLVLFNPYNEKYIDDIVIKSIDVNPNEIKVVNYIKEKLKLKDGDELVLIENVTYSFSNISVQKIENIKENNIVISMQDINGREIKLDKFSHFQFFNYYTKESIIVKKSHIKIDASLKNGTILLNMKQRIFLGLELPLSISDSYWDEIIANLPKNNIEDLNLLNKAYSKSDHILISGLDYKTKQEIKNIINNCCRPYLNIVPIIGSYSINAKLGFKLISDFYVGKSTLSLLCRRPYTSDDGFDIVRISPSNMNLLGISEMDKVIIKNKNKSVRCQVLELDDEKAFLESNVPTILNYAIGIPVHIRKQLEIYDVNVAVKVDRDTSFILKKSVNEQIIPILLTIFSINLFEDPSIWKKALISLLFIPIVVYLNLSPKRNMRG